jgi:hypothetical protein
LAWIDTRKLAIVPANTSLLESSVAAALDTALFKLSAQKTIRKTPKPLMYNRQTVVTKTVIDDGGWASNTWDEESDSSGWGSLGVAETGDDSEGLRVQYKASSWSEDTFFRKDKKLGKYRCYIDSLLRWNWMIDDDEGKLGEEGKIFEDNVEEEYDLVVDRNSGTELSMCQDERDIQKT